MFNRKTSLKNIENILKFEVLPKLINLVDTFGPAKVTPETHWKIGETGSPLHCQTAGRLTTSLEQ